MSKSAMLKIKQAEAEAQKIRADAAEAAKERIREAEETGKKLCDIAEAEAVRVNAEKIRKTGEVSERLINNSREEARLQAEQLAADCEPNTLEAVRVIIEGVFELCQ